MVNKSSFKYFIGYNDNGVIRPLRIKHPQMIGYNDKKMSFKVIDKGLLKRYIKIWERINNLMGKELDSEPVHGHRDKYIKTKMKSYGDKVNTHFQGEIVPKENASYRSLSLIMLDSVIKVNKKYHLKPFLKSANT